MTKKKKKNCLTCSSSVVAEESMSAVRRFQNVPNDCKQIVNGYVKRAISINIPFGIYSLIVLYTFAVSTLKLLELEYYVWSVHDLSLSWVNRIFCIGNVYWKLTFNVSTLTIDVYPKLKKYDVNKGDGLQEILTVDETPWNSDSINNATDLKLMIELDRNTKCGCKQLACVKIFIFNDCDKQYALKMCDTETTECDHYPLKKNMPLSKVHGYHQGRLFHFDHSDACIRVILEENFFIFNDVVTLTHYDGQELYFYDEFMTQGQSQGCCCLEAANEGVREDQRVDSGLFLMVTNQWERGVNAKMLLSIL